MRLFENFAYYLTVRESSPRTVAEYVRIATKMSEYLKREFDADFEADTVTALMIQRWAGSIAELKPSSRKLYQTAAKEFLRWLNDLAITSKDLTKAMPNLGSLERMYQKHPEDRPNKRAYTPEEIRLMLTTPSRRKEVTLRNHALIATLVATGLRIFEALQLNVGDVCGDSEVRVARKGTFGNKVAVTIPKDDIREYVEPYLLYRIEMGEELEDDSPLFVSHNGERLSHVTARAAIADLEKSLGLPTGLHTFRHTAVTEATHVATPAAARDLAGHKSLNITSNYVHTTKAERDAAASKIAQTIFHGEQEKPEEPNVADLLKQMAEMAATIQELKNKMDGQG